MSVGPLAESYPIYATYQYAGNNPIGNIDLDELEPGGQLSPEMQQTLNEAQQAGAEPLNPSPAGTISERKTTRLERWRDNVESGKAGFISRMAYHMVNDVWVGAQDMTPGIDRPRNMGGGEVSGSERQNGAVGFLGAAMSFLTGGLGKMITLPTVEITAARGAVSLTKSQLRSINSLEKQIIRHQEKLSEYVKSPAKFDNKGILEKAPNEKIRNQIIQSRIRHLEKEIKTFQDNISKIRNGQ